MLSESVFIHSFWYDKMSKLDRIEAVGRKALIVSLICFLVEQEVLLCPSQKLLPWNEPQFRFFEQLLLDDI